MSKDLSQLGHLRGAFGIVKERVNSAVQKTVVEETMVEESWRRVGRHAKARERDCGRAEEIGARESPRARCGRAAEGSGSTRMHASATAGVPKKLEHAKARECVLGVLQKGGGARESTRARLWAC